MHYTIRKVTKLSLALSLTALLWGTGASQSYAKTSPPKSTKTPIPVPSAPNAQVLEGPFGTARRNNVPKDLRDSRNLLVVGQPTKLPLVTELNAQLPAPFNAGSDEALNRTTKVIYRPGEKAGYLQLLASPWNDRRVVLAVLGNTNDGLCWASTALLAPTMLQSLSGHFAIVIADQVLLGGTRLSSPAAPTATGIVANSPLVAAAAAVPATRYVETLAPEKDTLAANHSVFLYDGLCPKRGGRFVVVASPAGSG